MPAALPVAPHVAANSVRGLSVVASLHHASLVDVISSASLGVTPDEVVRVERRVALNALPLRLSYYRATATPEHHGEVAGGSGGIELTQFRKLLLSPLSFIHCYPHRCLSLRLMLPE